MSQDQIWREVRDELSIELRSTQLYMKELRRTYGLSRAESITREPGSTQSRSLINDLDPSTYQSTSQPSLLNAFSKRPHSDRNNVSHSELTTSTTFGTEASKRPRHYLQDVQSHSRSDRNSTVRPLEHQSSLAENYERSFHNQTLSDNGHLQSDRRQSGRASSRLRSFGSQSGADALRMNSCNSQPGPNRCKQSSQPQQLRPQTSSVRSFEHQLGSSSDDVRSENHQLSSHDGNAMQSPDRTELTNRSNTAGNLLSPRSTQDTSNPQSSEQRAELQSSQSQRPEIATSRRRHIPQPDSQFFSVQDSTDQPAKERSPAAQILSEITSICSAIKVTGSILKQDMSTETVVASELPARALEGVRDVLKTCQQQEFQWDEITDPEQCVRQAALRRNDQKTKLHPKEGARVSCQTCSNSNKACIRRIGPSTIAIVALPTPLRSALSKDDPALWIRSEGGRTSMKLWRE